jgi:nitrate reductase gamma subunit
MHNLLFGIFPYIAITIMLVGSIARYERDPFTWKTKSSQLLRKRQFVIGSVLFHVGILAIFAGHVVGLLTPSFVWHLLGVSYGAKQIIAIVAGGLAGLATLAGGAILLHRRLSDPRIRANSSFGDNAVMAILVAQVTLGLATIPLALGHLDGSEMVKFMAWAQGTLTFQAGAAAHIADVHLIFKLHIFLGLVIFVLVPFTRLAHLASGLAAPIRYVFARKGYQIVRSRRGAKEAPAGVAPMASAAKQPSAARPVPVARPTPAE